MGAASRERAAIWLRGATCQWYRNGTAIGGATSASYTIAATSAADDGAKFKVEVTQGGTTVTSDEVLLEVVDLTGPVNPNLSLDFDLGQPAGTEISGTGTVDSFGGVNDSGVLKLTISENDRKGGFLSGALEDGAQLLEFTLAADVLAGLGTAVPADGFSVCIGNDLPVAAPGDAEAGAGSGDHRLVQDWNDLRSFAGLVPGERWVHGVPYQQGLSGVTNGVDLEIAGVRAVLVAFAPPEDQAQGRAPALLLDDGSRLGLSGKPVLAWRGWPPIFTRRVLLDYALLRTGRRCAEWIRPAPG